ncbi:MAG TPA: tRNA (guanosine(37)-N1)-methyltransferase TrmD [Deltaproteobacteria bacterium]|nr:tRNA (guanosine(37)-N1)-methyltransferase TrmD [Deltaproteobacteria bacterium]
MRFDILTLFPAYFDSPLKQSVLGRAAQRGLIEVRTHDIRDFARDRHRTTDDSPYGGGAGMVMKVEPVVAAIESLVGPREPGVRGASAGERVVMLTPQGEPFDQAMASRLAALERVVLLCGRYEGFDERIRAFVDMELSVGDYVLSGGEPAALVVVDAVARLVEGVLGNSASALTDSFSSGLLEHPHYTRPDEFRGLTVPAVLLSGDHGAIERWRRAESRRRTLQRRPDLAARGARLGGR